MNRRHSMFRALSVLALAALVAGGGSRAFGLHGCVSDVAASPDVVAATSGAAAAHGHHAAHAPHGASAAGSRVAAHARGHAHALVVPPAPPADAAGTPAHAAAAGAASPDSADGHTPHGPTSPDHHGACTCLGTCHGSAAVPVLPAPPEAPAEVVRRQPAPRPADTRAPGRRPAFLLPYATAPPTLA